MSLQLFAMIQELRARVGVLEQKLARMEQDTQDSSDILPASMADSAVLPVKRGPGRPPKVVTGG